MELVIEKTSENDSRKSIQRGINANSRLGNESQRDRVSVVYGTRTSRLLVDSGSSINLIKWLTRNTQPKLLKGILYGKRQTPNPKASKI